MLWRQMWWYNTSTMAKWEVETGESQDQAAWCMHQWTKRDPVSFVEVEDWYLKLSSNTGAVVCSLCHDILVLRLIHIYSAIHYKRMDTHTKGNKMLANCSRENLCQFHNAYWYTSFLTLVTLNITCIKGNFILAHDLIGFSPWLLVSVPLGGASWLQECVHADEL